MSSSEPRANYSPGAPSASLSQGEDTRLPLHLVSYDGLRDASLLPFSTISQQGKLETLCTVFPSYLSSQIVPVILLPTHPPFWPEAGLVLIVRDLFSTCPPALFFLRLSSHLQDIGFDTVHQPGHRIWSLAFCWEAEMLTADGRRGRSVQGQRMHLQLPSYFLPAGLSPWPISLYPKSLSILEPGSVICCCKFLRGRLPWWLPECLTHSDVYIGPPLLHISSTSMHHLHCYTPTTHLYTISTATHHLHIYNSVSTKLLPFKPPAI